VFLVIFGDYFSGGSFCDGAGIYVVGLVGRRRERSNVQKRKIVQR
jgi:hypothetical protein